MDREKKERLEGMLRAIQDIKSENEGLVGTSEVWKMLKEEQNLYEVPKLICGSINGEIQKTFSEITYKATPERIWGLNSNLVLGGIEKLGEIWTFEYLAKQGAKRFDWGCCYDNQNGNLIQSKDYFLPFFLDANLERIEDDEDIGYIVLKVLDRDYKSISDKIEKSARDKCDDYILELFTYLSAIDWKEAMSNKVMIEQESFHRRAIFEDGFDYESIIFRVKRDQTEGRIEYRRRILSHVLSSECNKIGLSILGLDNSWESFVERYDRMITRCKREINDLRLYNRGVQVEKSEAIEEYLTYTKRIEEITDYKKKPMNLEEYIKKEEVILERNKFIRHLLGQEKNWVEKVLKS